MTGPAVAVEGLQKRFEPAAPWFRAFLRSPVRQTVVALDDVSFTVDAGEVCAIAGANGAGKSTLFRILIGLVLPTAGRAHLLGVDVTEQPLEVRRSIGFVPADDRSLWLNLTCRTNLVFRGRLQGMRGAVLDERIDAVLAEVELSDMADRVGYALSAGMRARLQLASALLHDPPVLILDEPTSSVDPVGAHRLLELLRRMAVERGTAILYSTHRVEELDVLRESVLLLNRGKVVHRGSLAELRSRWETSEVEIEFDQSELAREAGAVLASRTGVDAVVVDDAVIRVQTALATGRLLAQLPSSLEHVTSVRESRQPLHHLLAAVLAGDADRLGEP